MKVKRLLANTALLFTVIACHSSSSAAIQPTPVIPSLEVAMSARYENVEMRYITGEAYLEELPEHYPELAQAIEKGWVQGIYFHPIDPEEIRQIAENFVRQYKTSEEADYEREVRKRIKVIQNIPEGNRLLTLFDSESQGKGHSTPIIVRDSFFTTRYINNEHDARNRILHEVKHAENYNQGDTRFLRVVGFGKQLIEMEGLDVEMRNIINSSELYSDIYIDSIFDQFVETRTQICPDEIEDIEIVRELNSKTGIYLEQRNETILLRDRVTNGEMERPQKTYKIECNIQ